MKKEIEELIFDFVDQKDRVGKKENYFRHPLVRFGDACSPDLLRIRETYNKNHLLPEDILLGAKTLITYFLPLNAVVAESNRDGKWSSKEWILSYGRTYDIICELNQKIVSFMESRGYHCVSPEDAFSCDPESLYSRWSLRHIGYYSGLGTMGLNNVLITPAGCCGRIASLVTDWDCEHDTPIREEYCLHKRDGSCGVCMERCVSGALKEDGYDRFRCNDYNNETDQYHAPKLHCYAAKADGDVLPDGCSCGKCICDLPCSYCIP